ncbi:MAG: glycoside hydrolase family 16 protein [Candidatus Hinthialibacter antarcticus]|nr:glycoside hydrolase family 16 protein [Candidatus Hinthialibacter antarcticus]
MFRTSLLILIALFVTTITHAQEAPEGYQLVWSDEFNQDGAPNPENWIYERGFVRNDELQWYQQDNVRCEDGLLVIEGRRERKSNPRYDENSRDWRRNRPYAEYTSACVLTRGKHDWQYGRFEVRARFETEPGLWPAIWMLGVSGEWPACGEIDIMEYYRGMVLANACWASGRRWQAIWDDSKTPMEKFNDPEWASKFHVWRMDWDEERIDIYLDDKLLNTIDLTKTVNQDSAKKNPFHQPHYLLLNLAVGGTNGGDPSETTFPTRYEVDYVRVYQKTE